MKYFFDSEAMCHRIKKDFLTILFGDVAKW